MSLFYRTFGDISKYTGLLIGIYSTVNSSETDNSSKVGIGIGLTFYLLGNHILRREEEIERNKILEEIIG